MLLISCNVAHDKVESVLSAWSNMSSKEMSYTLKLVFSEQLENIFSSDGMKIELVLQHRTYAEANSVQ